MKKLCKTSTALILIAALLLQVIMPHALMAQLTSLNTQPEIWSYQPVDATDNVNLATGAFNYTVPITSLPEFPMAIGYSSGVKMNQEAGMFGLGFNGFTGAIGRNVMGIPDDVNEGSMVYTSSNQKMFDASLTGTVSIPIMDKIMGPVGPTSSLAKKALSKYGSFSPSFSLGFGYNNYTGVYGVIGLGLNVGLRSKAIGNGDFGLSSSLGFSGHITADSRSNGLTYGASANIGIDLQHSSGASLGLSGGTYVGGVDGSKVMQRGSSVGLNGGFSRRSSYVGIASSLFESGNNSFSNVNGTSASSLPQLPAVNPAVKGWGASISYSVAPSITLTAGFRHFNYGDETEEKKAYGFSYLGNYNRSYKDHLADFTIEGENSFNPADANNPSYLQRDYFTVNTMGLSGTMQEFQPEYGVVSRNYSRQQQRDIGLIVTTSREEVYQWHNATATASKKGVDILALLKKKTQPEEKDADNVLFEEKEVANLNGDDRRFGNTTLRMKGDYAGEFNFSDGPFDRGVNKYRMEHVTGTSSDLRVKAFGIEQQAPVYSPAFAGNTAGNYKKAASNAAQLAENRGTNIKKYTIAELVKNYNGDESKLAKSFYVHKKLAQQPTISNPARINTPANAVALQDFTILEYLKTLKNTQGADYIGSLTGAVEMTNTGGMRYFFNLPVFNKGSKSIGLKGKGINPPQTSGNTDYHSFDGRDRSKTTTDENFIYPYAWLLTAIVGPDYVDFDNIPGPSDGDLGFWVKIKYVRTSDNYRWRAPFSGMSHMPGAFHTYEDDYYSMQTGTKEIYYISEIESPDYLVKYQMEQRIDGIDAAAIANGITQNATETPSYLSSHLGSNYQFAVTAVRLYKKHDSHDNSKARPSGFTLVRATTFEYDYSLCPGVPNNYAKYFTKPSFVNDYDYNNSAAGTQGKLTLKKVQNVFYDDAGNAVKMPSYQFDYGSGPEDNPPYNPEMIDQWGNYLSAAQTPLSGPDGTKYFYSSYTEVSPGIADQNAKAHALKQVYLPSGGTLAVHYKAKSYGYVENNVPYVMRRFKNLQADGENAVLVDVDVSDMEGNSLEKVFKKDVFDSSPDKNPLGISIDDKQVVNPRDKETGKIYGEAAFYKDARDNDPKHIYIANDMDMRIEFPGATQYTANGRTWQQVRLVSSNGSTPFIATLAKYLYTESDLNQAMKSSLLDFSTPQNITDNKPKLIKDLEKKYEDQEKADVLDAVKQIGANVRNVFDGNTESKFNSIFGEPGSGSSFIQGLSFIRTPIYKAKYTGAVVDRIEMRDGFDASLATNGTSGGKVGNRYFTRYHYDERSNGAGMSSGVATIEPGGGKSCVIDVMRLKGAGFAPSPSITYAKTTVGGAYSTYTGSAAREKGVTVYEFYTSKLKNLRFASNFKEETMPDLPSLPNYSVKLVGIMGYLKFKIFGKTIKIPCPIPVLVDYKQTRSYKLKSYTFTDNTDLIGKQLAITVQDAAGATINYTKMSYYGDNEAVPVHDQSVAAQSSVRKPGKIDQVWSEAYYTKETDNKATLGFLYGRSKKNYAYTNMKYSYLPPVLKLIEEKQDVSVKYTENAGFDFYTGSPVVVKTSDSYGNKKVTVSEPAYWRYPTMGAVAGNSKRTNQLTETTANTTYLNTIAPANVLSASATTFTDVKDQNGWKLVDFLQPSYFSKFLYTKRTAENQKSIFSTPVFTTKSHIKHTGNLYRAHKSFTYRADLNPNGTFKTFTADLGNDTEDGEGWHLVSENTLYNHRGEVLEVKDILGNYISTHLGHNMSYKIGTVTNGSYNASVFEGAEDQYLDATGTITYLNNGRVDLGSAIIVPNQPCNNGYDNKVLSNSAFYTDRTNVFRVRYNKSNLQNTTLFSLDVVFSNSQARTLNFYKDKDNILHCVTNLGEAFEGFYIVQQTTPRDEIMFNLKDFKSLAVKSSYTGIDARSESDFFAPGYLTCYPSQNYAVPCPPSAHSGNNLFLLENGKSGTTFILSGLDDNEKARKYKASVWVHKSSAPETELVVRFEPNGYLAEEKVVNLNEAYAAAGDWRLLRVDFSLAGFANSSSAGTLKVFVRNRAQTLYSYYDDLRVLPYQAVMENAIYDPAFDRTIANLDGESFASFMRYDVYGRLIERSVEVQNVGKKLVQRKSYHFQRPID